jgi:hypothetical protein
MQAQVFTLSFLRLVHPALHTAADSDQIFLCSSRCKSNRFVPDILIGRQHSCRPLAYCKRDLDEYLP